MAALHYNGNADRAQRRTALGKRQYGVKNPKARKGKPVAFAIKEPATFGVYIDVQEEQKNLCLLIKRAHLAPCLLQIKAYKKNHTVCTGGSKP